MKPNKPKYIVYSLLMKNLFFVFLREKTKIRIKVLSAFQGFNVITLLVSTFDAHHLILLQWTGFVRGNE